MGRVFAVLLLGALMGALTGPALGEDALTPPPDARKLFEFSADGVQIYKCKLKDEAHQEQGFEWVFEAPDAVLFDADGKKAGTHGKGPSWILADGSQVVGEVAAKQPSPVDGAIPWLLVKVKSHDGTGKLGGVTFIRRVNTDGGTAPAGGCDAARKGETERIPYSATYEFFGP